MSYKCAVSSQKCIRAGGKHNDLENVGQTGRHHTFFEMLGNFSFGDYFKEDAIKYAWDWVTRTLNLPADKLYATVYEEDDDAFDLWGKIAPELKNGRILRFGKKDNYWSMGEVGPCGPCSEIHLDKGEHLSKNDPTAWINNENERFVEIWNLVFMQYDQLPDGKIIPLPKPSVDTGAGLERIAAAMQKVDSNYETDLFAPLTAHVADITGVAYDPGVKGTSHRVIADHVRALVFALADGGGLSNEGRGYVLRRILRRAARHGRLLGCHKPIICRLAPTLIDIMGGYFTELREKRNHIEAVIKSEEERFGESLDTGLELFSTLEKKVKRSGSDTIPGEDIFKLSDTYGFPVDMTAIMAAEAGLKLDMAGFDRLMSHQQEQSRTGSDFGNEALIEMKRLVEALEKDNPDRSKTIFVRGDDKAIFDVETKVVKMTKYTSAEVVAFAAVLESTPFYAESGGQIGDVGVIENSEAKMIVSSVVKHQDEIIHVGRLVEGGPEYLLPGTTVTARLDKFRRWDIMRNHTATHLLQKALRLVLGEHVKQSGSLVEADHLRFDFAHFKALTPEEIADVEKIVNEKILEGMKVGTEEMPADKAMKSGAMALFGEKYGDTVRVVSVGDFSKELCGGTHVTNTAEIGSFLITEESAIASGVRRIEAVTGRVAAELSRTNKQAMDEIGALLNVPGEGVVEAVRKISSTVTELQKENKKLKVERFSSGTASVGTEEQIGAVKFHHHDFGETDQESASGWADQYKSASTAAVAVAVGILDGKRTFIASASKAAIEAGIDAGRMFGELVKELGGRGGGKTNFARGGLPDGIAYDDFIARVKAKLSATQ